MNSVTRILLLLLMFFGLMAFAITSSPKPVSKSIVLADGTAPMPTCTPTMPGCTSPIIKK